MPRRVSLSLLFVALLGLGVLPDLAQAQEQRLDEALTEANTEELRKAFQQNDTVTTELEEPQQDVNVRDVVAIKVIDNGDVGVYHEPAM